MRDQKLTVRGVEYRQDDETFITIHLPHNIVKNLAYSRPMTSDDPNGDQRLIDERHVLQFTKAMQEQGAKRIQSCLGTLVNGAKVIRGRPSKRLGFSHDLLRDVQVQFPAGAGKFMRLQDGQHGITALCKTNDLKKQARWVWNISLSEDASLNGMRRRHSDLNMHHKTSSKSLMVYSDFMSNRLSPFQDKMGRVFSTLRHDDKSFLYERVIMFADDVVKKKSKKVGKSIGFDHFVRLSETVCLVPTVMAMSHDVLYTLVRAYYDAWATTKRMGTTEWINRDAYLLGDVMGIKSITRAMALVFQKVLEKNGSITEKSLVATTRWLAHKLPEKMWLRKNGLDHGYKTEHRLYHLIKGALRLQDTTMIPAIYKGNLEVKARKETKAKIVLVITPSNKVTN